MKDLSDENLDTLLRQHFRAELDGQLDKARRAELDRAPAVSARSSRRSPWRAWRLWAMPLASAAAVAAIFVLPSILEHGPEAPVIAPQVLAKADPQLEHEIQWNTVDQGTVLVNDDTPMRSIRRSRVDNLRWVDPETHATMQMSVPNDEVVLVGMHAN